MQVCISKHRLMHRLMHYLTSSFFPQVWVSHGIPYDSTACCDCFDWVRHGTDKTAVGMICKIPSLVCMYVIMYVCMYVVVSSPGSPPASVHCSDDLCTRAQIRWGRAQPTHST